LPDSAERARVTASIKFRCATNRFSWDYRWTPSNAGRGRIKKRDRLPGPVLSVARVVLALFSRNPPNPRQYNGYDCPIRVAYMPRQFKSVSACIKLV
jgi:hypothetical protein